MNLIAGCEVLGSLGRGVFKARHPGLGRLVALRKMRGRDHDHLSALVRLQHPNVIRTYGVGHQDGSTFLITQLLNGRSLEERLKEVVVLDVDEAVRIVTGIAHGLEAIHRAGIVHRNLNLSTIMLTGRGIQLTEIGSPRRTQFVEGSPEFLAPEAWMRKQPDPRSDLYSLGVVFHRMLTGAAPFRAKKLMDLMHLHLEYRPASVRDVRPSVPRRLEEVILRLLAKEPEHRYPNVPAFLEDLRASA